MVRSPIRRLLAVTGLMLSGVLAAPQAIAVPIAFGANHYNFISDPSTSWAAAKTAAAGMSFMGTPGHLATITSAAENTFLKSNFDVAGGFAGAWLGGDVTGPILTPNAAWVVGPDNGLQFWQNGAAVAGVYANWGGIEPNNSPSRPYMNLGGFQVTIGGGVATGQWADASGGSGTLPGDPIIGYLIEFEGTASPVPEPATLALLGFGLAGIGALRRRRRPGSGSGGRVVD